MKKKTFILLLIVFIFDMGCAGKNGGLPETSKSTVAHETAKNDISPESLIRSIYQAHQPWIDKNIISPSKVSSLQNYQKNLAGYFDDELTGLLVEDFKCASKKHEECKLGFDPILGGEDYDDKPNLNLKINKMKSDANTALYEASFTPFANEKPKKLTYQLRLTDHGWRVSDIIDGRNSLKNTLQGKS